MIGAPADAAMFEGPLLKFIGDHKLRFKWARQDTLRMEAADGGPQAPVCITFPASFWLAWAIASQRTQSETAKGLAETVQTRYSATCKSQIAQQIQADARSLSE